MALRSRVRAQHQSFAKHAFELLGRYLPAEVKTLYLIASVFPQEIELFLCFNSFSGDTYVKVMGQ